jgi:hypothetical protein
LRKCANQMITQTSLNEIWQNHIHHYIFT